MTEASEWAGPVGDVWAAEWRRTDRSFAGLSPHLDTAILAAAPSADSAVDIGCGAGSTSIALAQARSDLDITGIDLSTALVTVARERAAGYPHLHFEDGGIERALPRSTPVDLFFSRHGVMFFPDPGAGFTHLRRAAAPGAAFVFSCFRSRDDNPWAGEVAGAIGGGAASPPGYQPGPFAFADPLFVGDVLASAGWQSDAPTPIDFRYRAGEGADPIADALDFFQRIGPVAPLIRAAAPTQRDAMLHRLRDALEQRVVGDAVEFPAAAWLWSARAA